MLRTWTWSGKVASSLRTGRQGRDRRQTRARSINMVYGGWLRQTRMGVPLMREYTMIMLGDQYWAEYGDKVLVAELGQRVMINDGP
jgi:hypothetical protein